MLSYDKPSDVELDKEEARGRSAASLAGFLSGASLFIAIGFFGGFFDEHPSKKSTRELAESYELQWSPEKIAAAVEDTFIASELDAILAICAEKRVVSSAATLECGVARKAKSEVLDLQVGTLLKRLPQSASFEGSSR